MNFQSDLTDNTVGETWVSKEPPTKSPDFLFIFLCKPAAVPLQILRPIFYSVRYSRLAPSSFGVENILE